MQTSAIEKPANTAMPRARYIEVVFAIFPKYDIKVKSNQGLVLQLRDDEVGICFEDGTIDVRQAREFNMVGATLLKAVTPRHRSGSYILTGGEMVVEGVAAGVARLRDPEVGSLHAVPEDEYRRYFYPCGDLVFDCEESVERAGVAPVDLLARSVAILSALRNTHGWSIQAWQAQLE